MSLLSGLDKTLRPLNENKIVPHRGTQQLLLITVPLTGNLEGKLLRFVGKNKEEPIIEDLPV